MSIRIGYGLNLEQSQKLIMTPELRQAITVLQLSALELSEYVQQELQENPVLEIKEDKEELPETEVEANGGKDDGLDVDWQEYFADKSDLGIVRQGAEEEKEQVQWENFLTQGPTLVEHLLFQLNVSPLDPGEKEIGEFIIGNLDDNGYLTCSTEEIARSLEVPVEKVEKVLRTIQTFDPAGVAARNLQECLLLQVEALGWNEPLLPALIQHHLTALGEGKGPKVARALGVPVEEIQRLYDLIKQLDPKPGRRFGGNQDVRYVVPDIVVEKIDGEYIVLVNDYGVPQLTINSTYRSILLQEKDSEARKYVEAKLNAASWLIRAIEQRRLTLYRVANCLVQLQKDFFDFGLRYLKPLNLKQVAELLDLHESTISRATANKYIQTPHGVFEVKYFFASGLESGGGQEVSSRSVKLLLKELISNEDPKQPLSDQKLAELLGQKGIQISRRTVAKYRDELGIPAAVRRKRY
ncbi:MAG: RNA polymerase factor sigma-54 [Bacillota bacterium]